MISSLSEVNLARYVCEVEDRRVDECRGGQEDEIERVL